MEVDVLKRQAGDGCLETQDLMNEAQASFATVRGLIARSEELIRQVQDAIDATHRLRYSPIPADPRALAAPVGALSRDLPSRSSCHTPRLGRKITEVVGDCLEDLFSSSSRVSCSLASAAAPAA
jgi:hypothetical protein